MAVVATSASAAVATLLRSTMKTTAYTLLIVSILLGCSKSDSFRLSDYQSVSRFEAIFHESTPNEIAEEIMKEIERYEEEKAYHYVSEDPETGGWQYGVIIVSDSGKVLYKKKMGVEM